MPCNDVTEILELHLDHEGRVQDYSLTKRTCGAEIGGASLLADLVRGLDAGGLEALGGADVIERFRPSEAEQFLFMKHLAALRRATRVYSGTERGAPSDACAVESLSARDDGVTLRLLVSVALLADEISGCGNCGSCGSHKKARAAR